MNHRDTSDPLLWARRINSVWPVHGGLGDAAAAWMDYLEQEDPERLQRCTAMAAAFYRSRIYGPDPKPWFYGALFSVATADEARRFAAPHPLTCAVIPATAGSQESEEWLAAQSEKVQELVTRIRAEIGAGLADG